MSRDIRRMERLGAYPSSTDSGKQDEVVRKSTVSRMVPSGAVASVQVLKKLVEDNVGCVPAAAFGAPGRPCSQDKAHFLLAGLGVVVPTLERSQR